MKTIYSLKEFSQKIRELATVIGKKYSTVKIELVTYNDGSGKMVFTSYIDGHGLVEGSTMEESIEKMTLKCIPPPKTTLENTDMEIDVSKEELTPL